MKVTISGISDKELAELLKNSGMDEAETRELIARCKNNSCYAEKMRILRKIRTALLDSIHEKQAMLDKLDNLIWCTEHGGGL